MTAPSSVASGCPRGMATMAVALLTLAITASAQQIPALAELPASVATSNPDLVSRRAALTQEREALHGKIDGLNARCIAVAKGSAAETLCHGDQTTLLASLNSHIQRSNDFNAAVEATYRPSGNGMVGGTGWNMGYNVPKPTPELIAKSRAMLAQQERLAGHNYSDAIDFDRYNFVIGIAAETNFVLDLMDRVVSHDEPTTGQYSIDRMPGYAALAGRSFKELACHSNGALICLAALRRKDVKAEAVVLYGPQITEKALSQWDELVRSGQVKSVTLVLNSGDPVPPLSLAYWDYVSSRLEGRRETYENKALLQSTDLTSAVNETAPRLLVHLHDCSFNITDPLHCHDMATYKNEGAR